MQTLNEKLEEFKHCIPKEFARKPRSIDNLEHWKATEFRQFLLYSGHYLLKDVLKLPFYDHFMLLSVAIGILVSEQLVATHVSLAEELLVRFNQEGKHLYGNEFLIYNVHNLIHLSSDAREFGSLDYCSAWKFESYLGKLRKKIHNGKRPIVQIVKRLSESLIESDGEKVNCIGLKAPNNAYMTNDGKYCEVIEKNGEDSYLCYIYHSMHPVFETPCNSLDLGLGECHRTNRIMQVVNKNSLRLRCIQWHLSNNYIRFFKLLHMV